MAAKKQQQKIEFTLREKTGTGVCRKIRAKNLVPVILYGPEHKEGLAGTVSARAIAPIANSGARETTVIELAMSDGKECMALIRDVQRHPLTQNIRHIDFYQVLKGHKIKVEIPIRVINKELAPGLKEGGLLNQITRSLFVEIKPRDIPEDIVVDIAKLEIGGEIFIKDLPCRRIVTFCPQKTRWCFIFLSQEPLLKQKKKRSLKRNQQRLKYWRKARPKKRTRNSIGEDTKPL